MSNMIKKIQENGNSLKQDVLRKRFKISSKLVCPSYFGCHAAGDELIIEAGIFVG